MNDVPQSQTLHYLENLLRANGIDPEQIAPESSQVADDYGNALVMLLETVNSLGMANVLLFQQVAELKTEVEALKNG